LPESNYMATSSQFSINVAHESRVITTKQMLPRTKYAFVCSVDGLHYLRAPFDVKEHCFSHSVFVYIWEGYVYIYYEKETVH